jgi:preprotein translocase subunit SecF
MEQHQEGKLSKWYDHSYKWMLMIPVLLLLVSVVYLYQFNSANGDLIKKDVSLTGGTTISLFDAKVNANDLKAELAASFPDVETRGISDIQTGKQIGLIITTGSGIDEVKPVLEKFLGYSLTSENSSVEFTKSTISAGFYSQLKNSIIAAFLLMACVVFLRFAHSKKMKAATLMLSALGVGIALADVPELKNVMIFVVFIGLIYGLWKGEKDKNRNYWLFGSAIVSWILLFAYPAQWLLIPLLVALSYLYITVSMPSFMVILCAFADIVMTIAIVNFYGMTISLAGIVAFLMLIGYSVDTDILMTSRLLHEKEGTKNQRLWGAFKTGIMMTLTAIVAVGISLIIVGDISATLHQIFTIILIGLFLDIINTWITNASLLKWYMEAKNED